MFLSHEWTLIIPFRGYLNLSASQLKICSVKHFKYHRTYYIMLCSSHDLYYNYHVICLRLNE